MRRLLPMILILLAGCACDQPVARKSLGERFGDFVFYNLNGGKTSEEVQADTARVEQETRELSIANSRNQENAIKYGSSY